MSRPDQSLTYLKNIGYSVLRMPRGDVRPLQTLQRSGPKDLTRLGEITNIMTPGINPAPAPSLNNVAPDQIATQETNSIKLEIGLTILGNILQALGGGNLGAATAFDHAKTVTFKYEGVLEDHVAMDQLDQYLSTASARHDQRAVMDALIHDAVYVITSTIKSRKVTVSAQADGGVHVGLDVPAIHNIASGNLKIDWKDASQGQVSFEGAVPVVFGFQAVQLFYDDQGKYTTYNPLDSGAAAMKAVGQVRPTYLALEQGALFRLAEADRASAR